jgi:hypothetical protein
VTTRTKAASRSAPARRAIKPVWSRDEGTIARDPASAKHPGSMTTWAQDATISCVAELLIRDVPARIAAVLLRMTGSLDGIEPDNPRGFGLTLMLIGDLAGASCPTVGRDWPSSGRGAGSR